MPVPSIFTHLVIAQDALEAQPPGPGRDLLEANSRAYFLGALCPDLPYFDIFHTYRGLPLGAVLGPVTHTVEARVLAWLGWSMPEQDGWALRLHSVGAPAILAAWARHALRRPGPFAALCAGMLTHCAADEVLHPKVNADSGGSVTAESLRRHRELEINLDYVLLRSRGVAVESLSLGGFLEASLGRVDQTGGYLAPSLKHAWIEASAACDGERAVRRGELDAWSRGFAGAMRLLEHPLSPMQQQKRRFSAGGEERWRTFFARERYLSSHVPRAARAAEAELAKALRPGPEPAAAL
jgi:hypothetical protein